MSALRTPTIQIDIAQLAAELHHLASFTEAPQAGVPGERAVTRIVFSEDDRLARTWLKSLFHQAGLHLREDAVGNTFARWTGTHPALPAVATGSHIDAIADSGMFDGTLGVLGALEAIRALQRTGIQPRRSVELLLFTAEEPTRFGIGCLGSRLLSGSLDPARADALHDPENQTLNHLRHRAGFRGPLSSVPLPPGHYSAFVELHIEQGPLLERDNIAIGIVSAIAAPAGYRIRIDGQGRHAGTLLPPDRRDALCAAAEVILIIERAALTAGSIDTIATIGTLVVHPGAVNSVPRRVDLQLDLRDTDRHRRDNVFAATLAACAAIEHQRRVTITFDEINADPPALCDPGIISAIEAACDHTSRTHRPMVSHAYHDTLFLARLCPVGMIFVPCRNGVSHRPDEFATVEAMHDGVLVLAETLAHLAAA